MAKKQWGKCYICGAERVSLIDANIDDEGILTKIKVCTSCWKGLWDEFFKSKEVKIA
jgi:hypothetical protein